MRFVYSFFESVLTRVMQLYPDRYLLEKIIFPLLCKDDRCNEILFVGTHWYTKRYNSVFVTKSFTTIDIDPKRAVYGSDRHIVTSLEEIACYFKPDSLDVIVCNGVMGWGLNEKKAINHALKECCKVLKKGGILILGWNNTKFRCPFPLHSLNSLSLFSPYDLLNINKSEVALKTYNRHVFSFYQK